MNQVESMRRAMAYEAFVMRSYLLYTNDKLPESIRFSLTTQIERMRQAVRGNVREAYQHVPPLVYSMALNEILKDAPPGTDSHRPPTNQTDHRSNRE